MIEALAHRLSGLTGRERLLLLLMALVALPLAILQFVLLPLHDARRAAEARLTEATALHQWVQAQVAALPVGGSSAPAEPNPPLGLAGIEQTLRAAGLRERLERFGNGQGENVVLTFTAVPFAELVAWLDSVTPHWGYRIAALRIDRAETPGTVTASLELAPAK